VALFSPAAAIQGTYKAQFGHSQLYTETAHGASCEYDDSPRVGEVWLAELCASSSFGTGLWDSRVHVGSHAMGVCIARVMRHDLSQRCHRLAYTQHTRSVDLYRQPERGVTSHRGHFGQHARPAPGAPVLLSVVRSGNLCMGPTWGRLCVCVPTMCDVRGCSCIPMV